MIQKAIHEVTTIMQICVWKKGFITSELFAEKLFKFFGNDVEGFNVHISQSIYAAVEDFNNVFSLNL